jgi:DNA repair protein RecO (recombination protein O)
MASFSTPAIVIRRIDYGDFDFIVSFLSLKRGKLSAIAKSAKKSTKRFGGVLELFSVLDIVCRAGKGESLPVLQEAALTCPFPTIRSDVIKTAYASYWSEIIDTWSEEGQQQVDLYRLFSFTLKQLDSAQVPADVLSILFQFRFLSLSGHRPNLNHCTVCGRNLDEMPAQGLRFDLSKGGLVCDPCGASAPAQISLNKAAVKQMLWMERATLKAAGRVRFSVHDAKETLKFLEVFLPYHLGKEPRSLKFLRQVRD